MFEIPDDDDLFSEENLMGFLPDDTSSEHQRQQQQQQEDRAGCDSGSNANVLRMSGHSQAPAEGPSVAVGAGKAEDGGSGSPRAKRMRVLADVNRAPSYAAAVPSCLAEDTAVSVGKAGVSRRASPPCQQRAVVRGGADEDDHPHATDQPRRRSLRKFPGPAGILPPAKPSDLDSLMRKNPCSSPQIVSEVSASKPEDDVACSQSGGEVFGTRGGAWGALLADLQPGADEVLARFSVRAMLHKASRRVLPKGKVPLIMGVVDSMDLQGSDASVVIRDPTGEMSGTLHREAVKDFSADLTTGAALVLRQVSVISPSSRTHYLNITAGNIVAIYPAQAQSQDSRRGGGGGPITPLLPQSSPGAADPADLQGKQGRAQSCRHLLQTCVRTAETELLEAANTAKQAALSRLRQRVVAASPAQQSPGTPAATPGLFSSRPYQGARAGPGLSTAFTPHTTTPRFHPAHQSSSSSSTTPARGGGSGFISHTPRHLQPQSSSSSSSSTPANFSRFHLAPNTPRHPPPYQSSSSSSGGGSRFSSSAASASPQMRRIPLPSSAGGGAGGGGDSQIRIGGGVNSTVQQGNAVLHRSSVTTVPQASLPIVPAASSTGAVQNGCSDGSSSTSSSRDYHHQNISCSRLQPSMPRSVPDMRQGLQRPLGGAGNCAVRPSTPSTPHGPGSSQRSGSMKPTPPTTPTSSNTTNNQPASQQPRWSFKHRGLSPAVQGPASSSSGGLRLQPGAPSTASGHRAMSAGVSSAAGSAVGCGAVLVKSANTGAAVGTNNSLNAASNSTSTATKAAAASAAAVVWEDELDDDILSQLSDDF